MLSHTPTTFSYEGVAIPTIPLFYMAMYVDYGHVSVGQNNCWWQLASGKSRTYTRKIKTRFTPCWPERRLVCLPSLLFAVAFSFTFNFQMQQVFRLLPYEALLSIYSEICQKESLTPDGCTTITGDHS